MVLARHRGKQRAAQTLAVDHDVKGKEKRSCAIGHDLDQVLGGGQQFGP